jgi:hypothetical protein
MHDVRVVPEFLRFVLSDTIGQHNQRIARAELTCVARNDTTMHEFIKIREGVGEPRIKRHTNAINATNRTPTDIVTIHGWSISGSVDDA